MAVIGHSGASLLIPDEFRKKSGKFRKISGIEKNDFFFFLLRIAWGVRGSVFGVCRCHFGGFRAILTPLASREAASLYDHPKGLIPEADGRARSARSSAALDHPKGLILVASREAASLYDHPKGLMSYTICQRSWPATVKYIIYLY